MFCQFARITLIENKRLDCIFLTLWMSVFIFCVWDFVSKQRYTTPIATNTIPQVTSNMSGHFAQNSSINPWCESGKVGNDSLHCLSFCASNDPFKYPANLKCLFPTELVSVKGFDEGVLTVGYLTRTFGFAVPGHLTYNWQAMRIASLRLIFLYTTTLTARIPRFVAGLNDAIQPTTTERTASTVVLDRRGLVWKQFEPGATVELTIAEIFWLADFAENDVLRQVQARTKGRPLPFTRKDLLGTPSDLPQWIFFTGADAGAQISCYNTDYDLQAAVAGGHSLGANFNRPVCVLRFRLYRPEFLASVLAEKTHGRFMERKQHAFRLKVSGSSGQFRAWDFSAILTQLVSMLVLLRFPSLVIRFVALYLLGQLSVVYRRAIVHTCDLTEQCGTMAVHLLQSASTFAQLADVHGSDDEDTLAISRQRLHERLSSALCCMTTLDDNEVARLAAFIFKALNQSSSSISPIGRNQYQAAYLANEDIDFVSMAKLFDADRRKFPAEVLFTPSSLRQEQQRCLQKRRQDWDSKAVVETKNTSELDCRRNSSCKEGHQLNIPSKPWQADCDDIVQMLGEKIQHLLGDVGKVSSKLRLLETHIEQLKPSHDSATARAPGTSRCESHTAGSSDLLFNAHTAITSDACRWKSLEMKVDSLQDAVVELEMIQRRSIQEEVALATSVALKEIHTLRSSLTASMNETHDAQINMERQIALLNCVIDDKQDFLQAQVHAYSEKTRKRQEFGDMTLQVPDVARCTEAHEPDVLQSGPPSICSDQFVQLWTRELAGAPADCSSDLKF